MQSLLNRFLAVKTWQVFVIGVVAGFLLVLGPAIKQHWQKTLATDPVPAASVSSPDVKVLVQGVTVSEQLRLEAVPNLAAAHYAAVIDLRPDGEEPDQPSSDEMRKVAEANHLAFHYVPVSHGEIPDAAVSSLQTALAESPRPVLLYCRSGRRAVRTFSLVEASRPDGPTLPQIIAAASAAGQDVSDLKDSLEARIKARKG